MQFGPYTVIRELGRGSMGIVYLARRPDLQRPFALKVMKLEAAADHEALERFRREARLASRVEHRSVVAVLDAGSFGGIPYYAMPYVQGETLRDLLHRGALAPEKAGALVRELADAVQAAHDVGCVHRDLKPANVIVDPSGRPYVTDFGLARDTAQIERLTVTGELIGTPYYMAPEQLRGSKDLDARVDVYALGVILYECLSGTRPYEAPSTALLAKKVMEGRPQPLRVLRPGVPAELEAIVLRALAHDRDARFAKAAEMRDALDRFLNPAPPAAKRSGLPIGWVLVGLALFGSAATVVAVGVHTLNAEAARREAAAHERVERMKREEDQRRAEAERVRRELKRRADEEAARLPDLSGAWEGDYGPNGIEKISIEQKGRSVKATKVTGDPWVPAGEVTFEVTLEDKLHGEGRGQLADRGHKNARFVHGVLTVLDADTIQFAWDLFPDQPVTLRRQGR